MTLRDQLLRDEGGVQLRLYMVNGVPHIGVGHNLRDVPIPAAAAWLIFDDDLARATDEVRRRLPWAGALDEVRFEALVQMAYQMGIGGVLTFRKALAAMQAGDWTRAAMEMLDSAWARDQTPARASRVAEQVRTGVRQ